MSNWSIAVGATGPPMSALAARTVLIIEDEPLVALDISQSFEKAGARVVSAHSRENIVHALDDGGITAAVLGVARGPHRRL
jgi:CheY-like chemotaxis protein